MKRGLVITLLLLLGVSVALAYHWQQQDRAARQIEASTLGRAFAQRYGAGAVIVSVTSPQKLYLVEWRDGTAVHYSLNVSGAWVDIVPQQ